MRELASDAFHWVLWKDETNGAFFLQAICNQSAAYFFVEFPLLKEEGTVLLDAQHALTSRGRSLLNRLADAAQSSPSRFDAQRRESWRAAGFDEPPSVPPLKAE